MAIKFDCPHCGRSLTVPDSEAGLPVICNACGQRHTAPGRLVRFSHAHSLESLWETLDTRSDERSSADRLSDMVAPPVVADGVSFPASPPDDTAAAAAAPAAPAADTHYANASSTHRGPGESTVRGFINSADAEPPADAPRWAPLSPPQPPPRRRLDVVQWTLIGVATACTLLLILVVTLATNHFNERAAPEPWDVTHRADVRRLINDADLHLIEGDLEAAKDSYTKVDRLIAGRTINDPAMRAELERVTANRQQVDRMIARRAAERLAAKPNGPLFTDPALATAAPAEVVPTPPPLPDVPPPPAPPPVKRVVVPLKVARQQIPPDPFSEVAIKRSIQHGVDWMIKQFDVQTGQLHEQGTSNLHGMTALCDYALLQSGFAIPDKRLDVHGEFMRKMLSRLGTLKIEKECETYGRGLRATALAIYNRQPDRIALNADVGWLMRAHKAGAYSYNEEQTKAGAWDNSNSQYGLLGVWSAAEAGYEVSGPYWKQVQDHWTNQQTENGSWGYNGGGESVAMTAAAIASLFVTHDYLDAPKYGEDVGRAPFPPALVKGMSWLERNDHIMQSTQQGYSLYGVERVGLASGFKFLGKRDWFRDLGTSVLARQDNAGSFGDPIETAYALLFLARGSHPVLMNKLRFDGAWANRPRDAANLARFASRALERPLNWQVVDADRPWTDWADSPLLYLASHEAPRIDEGQVEQLRRFVEAGGLLFTQADGGKPAFDAFARELARRIFPDYPMVQLPLDHELYSMVFPIAATARPALWAVSNGSRLLMVHSPVDLSMRWQQRAERVYPAQFQFGVNLFMYASGKGDLRHRLATTFIPPPPEPQGGSVKVARLRYAGNWDPEPAAWPRFARWFCRETDCGVNSVMLDLASLRPDVATVAHLTGTGPFTASDAEINALRHFVDGGGTLLVDVTGGNQPGAAAMTQLLARAFPDATLQKLPTAHPLFDATAPGMQKLPTAPALRLYAQTKLGKGAGVPEGFTHGDGQVIFTSLDLTSGLLGTSTWAISGYHPDYAQPLLKNLLLWSAAGRPTTQPSADAE